MHGPYSYLAVYAQGRGRTLYVPETVKSACDASVDVAQGKGALLAAISLINLELLRRRRWSDRCATCCRRWSRRSQTWSIPRWQVASVGSAVEKITGSHREGSCVCVQSSPRQVRGGGRPAAVTRVLTTAEVDLGCGSHLGGVAIDVRPRLMPITQPRRSPRLHDRLPHRQELRKSGQSGHHCGADELQQRAADVDGLLDP